MSKLYALLFLSTSLLTASPALAAPAPLKYEATLLTFACTTENGKHFCERLPEEIHETIELAITSENQNANWHKWVTARKFSRNFAFSANLRLHRNSDGAGYTLSAFFVNPFANAFDLGQIKMTLSEPNSSPDQWMLGSAEVPISTTETYSARLILKRVSN